MVGLLSKGRPELRSRSPAGLESARPHRHTLRPLRLTVALALVAAPLAAGCGSDTSGGGKVVGDTLTIYSSLPLQGPHKLQSQSIVNAEKLALQQAGGKAGSYKVNFAVRDDSTARGSRGPGWDPGRTADNASKAAQDSRTIAYLGEFDSGASAVSIPVTNEAGFVQVSPAATAVGLTKLVPGADKGEPDKFYPSGKRTFARVVPADDVQAAAAAGWAKRLGAHKVFLVDDRSVEGLGIVKQFEVSAKRAGLAIAGQRGMDPRADDYKDFAGKVAESKPDLVYFGGGVESNAAKLWQDLHAAMPDARLLGSDRLLVPEFYRRVGAAEAKTYLTSSTQDVRQLPAQGQRFLRDYRKTFGSRPDSYAAYGYTAMRLLLDAIRRAGDGANHRDNVIREVFDTESFSSPIGTFTIDDNGDTNLDRVAGYGLRSGRPVFLEGLRGTASG
jgi:branched-chain amino acid transport system substrate-binding protein